MVPLLGGAFSACTYHFFYNSPQLDALVALQVTSLLADMPVPVCRNVAFVPCAQRRALSLYMSTHSFVPRLQNE